jgi:FkbM family methyltransferase
MPLFRAITPAIKSFCRRFGIKIDRYSMVTSHELRLARMLRHHDVDLVIDVGASSGGYARSLRAAGYGRSILSFEPLPAVHQQLVRAAAGDAAWAVADPMALGGHAGRVQMNVSSNSDSSSLLDMLDSHAHAAPESRYVKTETVLVERLDGVRHPFIESARSPFLKIDTQGYEAHVLSGAEGLLPKLQGIQVEMSLEPLYAGQTLWLELLESIEARGFRLWSLVPGFFSPESGKLLQCDGVFFRETASR